MDFDVLKYIKSIFNY